jgi:2-pyrone-4,6-dicarboxylate lactonase
MQEAMEKIEDLEVVAPVNLPPDPNPNELRFAPPAGACDTHFHIFGPPHLFPFVSDRRYTPPACPIEHYLAIAKCIGIQRGVLTPSFAHGFDTASMLNALQGREAFLRGMIWADPSLAKDELEGLYTKGVRGIRFNFFPKWQGRLDRTFVLKYVEKLPERDWVLDFFIDSSSIKGLKDLATDLPYPVVVDHFAFLEADHGREDIHFQNLLDLCEHPNVWIKISGANRLMMRGARYEDVVAVAHALVERSPSRLIWGTDWPHTDVFVPGNVPNDGDLMNMLIDFVPDVTTRNRILVDNAARLFGFVS